MTRILTVDDSRAIRSIVVKQVKELGFEADEAEHGQEGLQKLEACVYDLVVLDVTMPIMDGPEMLKQMRAIGNTTPVLMLTSESKRSTIADVMKAGIDDYILKPFKPEELAAKIRKALRMADAPRGPNPMMPNDSGHARAPEPTGPTPVMAVGGAARQFIDVLVVDDMENVHKKLRQMLPTHISLRGAASGQAAIGECRENVYRVVLVDSEMPDVNSATLVGQLRLLQPHAAFLSLTLRTANDAEKEAKAQGLDGVMYKPFDRNLIEDFLLKFFDNQDLVVADDNLVKVSAFAGTEDRLDRYFQRVGSLIPPLLDKLAAACFDQVIVDISQVPLRPDLVPRLVIGVGDHSKKMGLELRLVGNPGGATLLKNFTETGAIPFYPSVAEARAA
jgi:two-component system cell cycle response regulator